MTRLERSIRHELAPYGPELRTKGPRRYTAPGHVGPVADHDAAISAIYATIEDGLCTDITLYCVGDCYEEDHYRHPEWYVDIAQPVIDYIQGRYDGSADESPWDQMIADICELCRAFTPAED